MQRLLPFPIVLALGIKTSVCLANVTKLPNEAPSAPSNASEASQGSGNASEASQRTGNASEASQRTGNASEASQRTGNASEASQRTGNASEASQETGSAHETTALSVEVEQRFAKAQELYSEGDLRGALLELEECYAQTRSANLLFNIAQLHRELDHCKPAIGYYERYVEQVPDGERVEDAKRHLLALRSRCSQSQSIAATDAAPPPSRPKEPVPTRVDYATPLGWVAIGLGAATAVGAVYAAVEANRAKRDVEEMSKPFDYRDYLARTDDFYLYRNWTYGLGAASLLSTAAGIYILTITRSDKAKGFNRQALAVSLRPASMSLDYRWHF